MTPISRPYNRMFSPPSVSSFPTRLLFSSFFPQMERWGPAAISPSRRRSATPTPARSVLAPRIPPSSRRPPESPRELGPPFSDVDSGTTRHCSCLPSPCLPAEQPLGATNRLMERRTGSPRGNSAMQTSARTAGIVRGQGADGCLPRDARVQVHPVCRVHRFSFHHMGDCRPRPTQIRAHPLG